MPAYIGYKFIDGEVVIDEEEAKVVKYIFNKYLSGTSVRALSNELLYADHKKVGKILDNKIYLGDELYPQLIETDLFNRVQDLRKKNVQENKRASCIGNSRAEYIFSNKLKCGLCGNILRKYDVGNKERWKCRRYVNGHKIHCKIGDIEDDQLMLSFVKIANKILKEKQILERKPKFREQKFNGEFNMLDRQIKELEEKGMFTNELISLVYQRSTAFYKTAYIKDYEYQTAKLKQIFAGKKEELQEFDKSFFHVVTKQIIIYPDYFTFELINGLTLDCDRN